MRQPPPFWLRAWMILRTFVNRTQSKVFDTNRENAIGRRRSCILRILMICKFVSVHNMMTYDGVEVELRSFFTSALVWRRCFLSLGTLLAWVRDSGIHWLGGYAGPDPVWAVWKSENILPLSEIETRYLDSPAAHGLSLQFLLTGGYNHVFTEVVSMI